LYKFTEKFSTLILNPLQEEQEEWIAERKIMDKGFTGIAHHICSGSVPSCLQEFHDVNLPRICHNTVRPESKTSSFNQILSTSAEWFEFRYSYDKVPNWKFMKLSF
jgi:hypothetical protein